MEEEVQEPLERHCPQLPCCGSSLSPGYAAPNHKSEKKSESRASRICSSEPQAGSAEDLLRFSAGSAEILLRFF